MSAWNTSYPRNVGTDRYVNDFSRSGGSSAYPNSGQINGTTITSPGVAKTLSFALPNGFNQWKFNVSWKDTAGNAGSLIYNGGTYFAAGVIAAPASGANGYGVSSAYGSSMTANPTPDDTVGQVLRVSFTQNTNAATVTYSLTYLNSNGTVN